MTNYRKSLIEEYQDDKERELTTKVMNETDKIANK